MSKNTAIAGMVSLPAGDRSHLHQPQKPSVAPRRNLNRAKSSRSEAAVDEAPACLAQLSVDRQGVTPGNKLWGPFVAASAWMI